MSLICPFCGDGPESIGTLNHVECVELAMERIAELEAAANTSICIFCGTTMDKDLNVMLDHAKGCERRPENNLLKRAEQAEAALEELVSAAEHGSCDMSDGCPPDHGGLYPDAKFCEGCTLGPLLADLRARAEEGSET